MRYMKLTFILFTCLFLLVPTVLSTSFTGVSYDNKSNEFNIDTDLQTYDHIPAYNDTITLINTVTDWGSAYSEYRLCNPALSVSSYDNTKLNTLDKMFIIDKGSLTDSELLRKINISVNTSKPLYTSKELTSDCGLNVTCTPTKYNNYTFSGYNISSEEITKWSKITDFNDFSLPQGKCFNFRIKGYYDMDNAGVYIDNIPRFDGINYTKYDIWNTSWSYYQNYTIRTQYNYSQTDDPVKIQLNSTLLSGKFNHSSCEDFRVINSSGSLIENLSITCNSTGNVWITLYFPLTIAKYSYDTVSVYYGNNEVSWTNNYDIRPSPTDNLLAYYPLDESSGTAYDVINDHHLTTIVGTPDYQQGTNATNSNYAIKFDHDTNEAVKNTELLDFDNRHNLTVNYWVKYIGSAGDDRSNVCLWNSTSSARVWRSVTGGVTPYTNWNVFHENGESEITYSPTTTTWQMYTGVYDSTEVNEICEYKNGTSVTCENDKTNSGLIDQGDEFYIGRSACMGPETGDNYIDEVIIWGYVLNSSQILNLYDHGINLPFSADTNGTETSTSTSSCTYSSGNWTINEDCNITENIAVSGTMLINNTNYFTVTDVNITGVNAFTIINSTINLIGSILDIS